MQASVCASPGKAEGGTGKPPPQKKVEKNKTTEGGGGGARKQPTATEPPANTTRGGQTPLHKAPKTGPPKRHRGTTKPKPATPSQEQRPTGKRDNETSRHTPRKKRKKKGGGGQQPSQRERGWGDRDHKARDRDTQQKKTKSAKNTPRQPSQEGLGTAETRAQHTRPHRTPEPEMAGGKRGAQGTTHVP